MLKKKPKISANTIESTLNCQVERAVEYLKKGEIIAFPTETCFGLGVDIDNEAAIAKLFEIKKRPLFKPILVLINDVRQLESVTENIPKSYELLIEEFWPGPLTLIFPAKKNISPLLTGNTGTIGVRQSSNLISRTLCQQLHKPITATSANISGVEPASSKEEVERQFGEKIAYIIEWSGAQSSGGRSTIAKDEGGKIQIVREGVLESNKILKILNDSSYAPF